MGAKLRRLRRGRAVEYRAGRFPAAARPCRRHAQAAGRHRPARSRPRGWRAAMARAAPVREMSGITFPGRALRAHLLRRRYRGDGADEARRAQRLPVAGRVPPVLPDAGQGPLAGDRHSPQGVARTKDDLTVRGGGSGDPAARREPSLSFKECSWFSTYRIHHRCRRALPRPALLPARRRGAHPQPDGRAGHEHRLAGCLQPRLEAGARGARASRRGLARHLRAGAHCPSRSGCCEPRTAPSQLLVSDSWLAATVAHAHHREGGGIAP